MTKVLRICMLCLLVNCYTNIAFSQYAQDQIIFVFESSMTEPEIIDFLYEEYNFVIVAGPTPVTKAYLAIPENGVYPPWAYAHPNGPINGIIDASVGAVEINGVGFNYETFDGLTNYSENGKPNGGSVCAGNRNIALSINDLGLNSTKTSVFDTGIAVLDFFSGYMNISEPMSFGTNFLSPGDAPLDDNNHGTAMSSIIVRNIPANGGGAGGTGGGTAAFQVELKTSKTHDYLGRGYAFSKIQALDASILEGVKIVNMSFSYIEEFEHRFDHNAPLNIAMNHAQTAGILCVASAGNAEKSNDVMGEEAYYPASFLQDNILSVAASDCEGNLAEFSNYGNSSIDIAAPGIDIPAVDMEGNWLYSNGTSASTALTTSLATQLATHQTVFDYVEIKCAILSGNFPKQQLNAYVLSGGYIHADNALEVLLSTSPCSHTGGPAQGLGLVINDNFNLNNAIIRSDKVELSITSQGQQFAQIHVFNTLGQLVVSESINLIDETNNIQLDLPSQLNSGIYFISVDVAGTRETIKVFRN